MFVYEAIGETLARLGVQHMFGLMGRANMRFVLHATESCGISYLGGRHENSVVSMADAYARASGRLGVCTVTAGPGTTNTLTGLIEANQSRTPLLLLAGAPPAARGRDGQYVDHEALFGAVGVDCVRLRSPRTVVTDLVAAARTAVTNQWPVVVAVPFDLQTKVAGGGLDAVAPVTPPAPAEPDAAVISRMVEVVSRADRPVILAGRGAVCSGAGPALTALADRIGALLATTMHASGLFAGHPYAIGTIGVHGSPLSVELLAEADAVLAFGASLDRLTTRAGNLFPRVRDIVHCDADELARTAAPVTLTVIGDAATTARALLARLERIGVTGTGYHRPAVRTAIAGYRWPVPATPARPGGASADESGTTGRCSVIDPRVLLAWLDEVLPRARTIVPETGHSCGYALEYLRVLEPRGAVNLFAYRSIGLGLAAAIGAATARPDRITVAVVGDGGLLMSLGELETLVRLRLPVLVLVMNDHAFSSEARELEMWGRPIDSALFPPVDFAAVAGALGAHRTTIDGPDRLDDLRQWLARPEGVMLADCKIDPTVPADWFRAAIGSPESYLRHPHPNFVGGGLRATSAGER